MEYRSEHLVGTFGELIFVKKSEKINSWEYRPGVQIGILFSFLAQNSSKAKAT
jgi:hypothetical protein